MLGAKIKAVAMDMSPAYISAVTEHLKEAAIVFDHFHVIKLFNDKLDEFRRKLYTEATTAFEKGVLKGTRWLLLNTLIILTKLAMNINDSKMQSNSINL